MGGAKRLDQMTRTEPCSVSFLFLLTPFCGLRYVSIRIEGGPVRDVREDLVLGPTSRGAFLPLGSMVSETHLPHDGMFLSQGEDRLRMAAPIWRPAR